MHSGMESRRPVYWPVMRYLQNEALASLQFSSVYGEGGKSDLLPLKTYLFFNNLTHHDQI
jgi:hypothetical protein